MAIARAAKVSIAYLATGQESSDDAPWEIQPLPNTEQERALAVRFCSWLEANGGLEKIAGLSGISTERLRSVCKGAPLSCGELAQLAKSANAPVEFLVTGVTRIPEPPAPSPDETIPARDQTKNVAKSAFLARFNALVLRHDGPVAFAKAHDLDITTVRNLMAGGALDPDVLARLASQWKVPIRWLLSDQPVFQGHKALEHRYTTGTFITKIEQIDDQRLFKGELDPHKGFHSNPNWRKPILDLLARIYEWLPPGDYDLHEVRVAIEDIAVQGDLAIIDPSSNWPESGIYLFHEQTQTSNFAFLWKVHRVQGILRSSPSSKDAQPLSIAEENYKCLGRAVVLIKGYAR